MKFLFLFQKLRFRSVNLSQSVVQLLLLRIQIRITALDVRHAINGGLQLRKGGLLLRQLSIQFGQAFLISLVFRIKRCDLPI